jgi:energy-coupling factor transporter transmembrane protein EcfT
MFWLFLLPVSVFVIFLVIGIVAAISDRDWGIFWSWLFASLIAILISFLISLMFNSMGTSSVPAISTPDIDNPVYLVSLSGDETISGAYILASGSFDTTETYRYHYYLPGTNKIASGSTKASRALIIEDNPEKPYYVEIKAVCPERNEFWTVGCNEMIPYVIEFHVLTGSVIQQIQVAP